MSKKEFVLKDVDEVRRLPADEAAELILKNHADELPDVVRALVREGHHAMGMLNQLAPISQIILDEYGQMQNIMHTVCEKWLTGYPRSQIVKEVLKSRENVKLALEGTPEAQA